MSVLNRLRLDEKTAIVTGGNQGIGRGITTALAEAGANVVIANRDAVAGQSTAEQIVQETGSEIHSISTDVTRERSVCDLVNETVDTFDTIDILVNNAGITINTPAEQMSCEEWQQVININLTGAFLCSKHIGNVMIDGQGGSIINVSSVSAFIANFPQPQTAYNTSKAGLEGFKNQLASEWATHDIRVNNINPGFIRTELIENVLENDPDMAEVWSEMVLQDEFADPADIGSLAVYLASDAAAYVTGTSVIVDGGYTVR